MRRSSRPQATGNTLYRDSQPQKMSGTGRGAGRGASAAKSSNTLVAKHALPPKTVAATTAIPTFSASSTGSLGGRPRTPFEQRTDMAMAPQMYRQMVDAMEAVRTKAAADRRRASDDELLAVCMAVLQDMHRTHEKQMDMSTSKLREEMNNRRKARFTDNQEHSANVEQLKEQFKNASGGLSYKDFAIQVESSKDLFKQLSEMKGRQLVAFQNYLEVVRAVAAFQAASDETIHKDLRNHRMIMDAIRNYDAEQEDKFNVKHVHQSQADYVDDGMDYEEADDQAAGSSNGDKYPELEDAAVAAAAPAAAPAAPAAAVVARASTGGSSRPASSSSSSSSSSSAAAAGSLQASAAAEAVTNKQLQETLTTMAAKKDVVLAINSMQKVDDFEAMD